MALTLEQLRERDRKRRAAARPPDPETAGGPSTPWWRGAVNTREDLPPGHNSIGDVFLVIADDVVSGALARWWDGGDWQPLAGGSGGIGPVADFIDVPADFLGRVDGHTLLWSDDMSEYLSGAMS